MINIQQNLTHKKLDLNFYYKLAEEAAQAYDIDQALKISQYGLKIAQVQNKAEWVEKFVTFNSQLRDDLLDQKTPSSIIIDEDFTIINGVGPTVAKKLKEKNINSIEKLAKTSPRTLAAMITGIGLETAQKIVNGARNYLSLNKLNIFSQSEVQTNEQPFHEEINDNLRNQDFIKLTDGRSSESGYEKSINEEYFFAKHRFWLIIRNLGLLFLLYSLALLVLVIFQQYSIFLLLINLGFILTGLLSIIIGYFSLKLHIIKSNQP